VAHSGERLHDSFDALRAATRAERAASVRHYAGCDDCRRWVVATQLANPDPGRSEDGVALAQADEMDPEFLPTIFGEG